MAYHRLFFSVFLTGAIMAVVPMVRAAEPLRFESPTPQQAAWLRTAPGGRTALALADLNEDGLPEYIVQKDTQCAAQKALCDFEILADSGKGTISLGHLRAYSLALGSSYVHNIRSLVAFRDPHDDYAAEVYVWDPAASRYMIQGQTTP